MPIKEIPEFYPILRASLNLAGLKDPPDVNSKFDFRPVLALAQRYQRHLGLTAEVVTSEQTSLGQRIREVKEIWEFIISFSWYIGQADFFLSQIDFAVSTLNNFLTERQKKYAKYTVELGKVREISASLRKITGLLPELVDSAWKLNDFLPADLQLDRLSLEKFTQPPAPATASVTVGAGTASVLSVIDGVEEQKVVDLSGSVEISAGPKLP